MTNADAEHLFIHPGRYKKICAAIRAMGTEEEARRVAEARAYRGKALFDEPAARRVAYGN